MTHSGMLIKVGPLTERTRGPAGERGWRGRVAVAQAANSEGQ